MNQCSERSAQTRMPVFPRLAALAATLLAGLLACGALLAALSGPVPGVLAAPAGTTHIYPGGAPCDTSLQACIDAASPGDTILISAGNYTGSLTLGKAVSLTGALSSTTILHALPNSRVLTVTGPAVNSSVVISGLTLMGGNLTDTTGCPAGCGAGMLVIGPAQPRLNSLILRNNTAGYGGGGLYNSGQPALSGSSISNNTAAHGGGVFNANILTLTDSLVSGNAAVQEGGGFSNDSILTLNNSTVSGNTAGQDGGGLSNFLATLTLNGSALVSNTAGGGGGLNNFGGQATLTGSTVTSNTAGTCGGILSSETLSRGALIISGSAISGNTGNNAGGVCSNNLFTLTNSTLSGNTSLDGAGGLLNANTATIAGSTISGNQGTTGGGLSNSGALTLTSSTVSSNTANAGGGVYNASTLTISSSAISSNTAALDGGGLSNFGVLSLTGGTVSGNLAGQNGGGLYLDGNLTLAGTQFNGNTAGQNGGGIYHDLSGSAHLSNALFARNTASLTGAALYLASPGSVTILFTTISRPAADIGTAVAIVSGTVSIRDTIITSYTTGISLTAGTAAEDYNLFSGVTVTTTGGVASGGHSLSGDPAFLNPAGDDYHLTAGSPARDAGANASVTTDFEGDPRPMGDGFDMGYDELRTPIAVADSYHLAQDTPLSVAAAGVLANDTDFNLGPMTAVLVSGPATGTLSLAGDGSFTYTPTLGFSGPVTFTYGAAAASLLSGLARVTLFVDLPPLANTGAPQAGFVAAPISLDGSGSSDPQSYTPLGYGWQQTGGPAVVLSSAAISRPTFSAPGSPAVLTFSLTVTDPFGLASAPVTTTVTVTDHVISGLSAASGSPTALGSATPFTATISAGTNVTYSWGFGDSSAPVTGLTVSHTYTAAGFFHAVVTATNSVNQVTATTTVTVDDVPVAANNTYTTLEDTPLHVLAPGVLGNDGDSFPGGLTAVPATSPLTGTLVLAPSGAFTYTPLLNANGPVTFTYRASDGLFNSAPALVTITVQPVNDPPTITGLHDVTTTVGVPLGPLPFTVGDVETPAGALTLTAQSSNTALAPLAGIQFGGSGAARTVTITPAAALTGTATITISVSDGLANTSEVFVLTVVTIEHKLFLPLLHR